MKNKLMKLNGLVGLLITTLLTYSAWRDGQDFTFYIVLWGVVIILFPTLIYIRNKRNTESN